MRNLNKHALTNYRRLVWICDTSFFGGMLFSLWVFHLLLFWNYEDLKELRHFFLFLTGEEEKKLKRRNIPFLFHLFALCADWTLVALTAGFLKKNMFSGERGQGRKKKKRRRETLKREESQRIHKLVYEFKFLQQLTLAHFNFSLITHPF